MIASGLARALFPAQSQHRAAKPQVSLSSRRSDESATFLQPRAAKRRVCNGHPSREAASPPFSCTAEMSSREAASPSSTCTVEPRSGESVLSTRAAKRRVRHLSCTAEPRTSESAFSGRAAKRRVRNPHSSREAASQSLEPRSGESATVTRAAKRRVHHLFARSSREAASQRSSREAASCSEDRVKARLQALSAQRRNVLQPELTRESLNRPAILHNSVL